MLEGRASSSASAQPAADEVSVVLDELRHREDAASTTPENKETAARWRRLLGEARDFLEDRTHSVAFVGSVGVGKSAMIGALARLFVGKAPKDKSSLRTSSVLAVGSGRTTVCEVSIRASRREDEGKLGLIVEPCPVEEVRKEIETYAQIEWTRRRPEAQGKVDDESDGGSQEVYRAIRNMTGYAEHREAYQGPDGKRVRRPVRPFDAVAQSFDSHEALAEHLFERAELSARETTKWWWSTDSLKSRKELKARFDAVNQGKDPTAPLPQRMTVVVPRPLPNSTSGVDLTLIDTRGLDGSVTARADIRDLLRDGRVVIVLCAPFKDAPGDSLRALLRTVAGDAELRGAVSRILLVVLDQGDAEGVPGANDDRELGQQIKVDECHASLGGAGTLLSIDDTQILAFDVLKDPRKRLVAAIDDRLSRLREEQEKVLRQRLADARSFLASVDDARRPELRATVDARIREAMAEHPLSGAPLSDPMASMYDAIDAMRWGSVVWATCLRRGTYRRFNLYAAVREEASRAATAWLDDLVAAVTEKLDELLEDPSLNNVQDHIRLRREQFESGQIDLVEEYATRVSDEVREALRDDPVWAACCGEWGRGRGFKDRVVRHLQRSEPPLREHETTSAVTAIPLLEEAVTPVVPPRFTLHVSNLRVLSRVSFCPEPVSLLVGANGAGKSTLLSVLRLLRVAYDRNLPDAVTAVLGGSHNLRSWGATEEVEVGLDLGDARWRIKLTPHEGSAYVADERLADADEEIFSRDGLGSFLYRGERLEPTPLLGVRALVDRGAHDPALRRVASFLERIQVFSDLDVWTLREQGSSTAQDRSLHFRGANALAVLRRWHQDRTQQHRWEFVIEGLRAAFPHLVADLDFVEAGNTLSARVYRPGAEQGSPIAAEANGVLQLLMLLCAVATADEASVLAIDEPENSLHPYAARAFLRRASRWAKLHNVTVLLATHSTILLDELSAQPEQVYVMKAEPGEPLPTRLDVLCDRDWLAGFKLGELYEQGEIGSNKDEPAHLG